MYTVTNRSTGKTSNYETRKAASRAADRMDLAYGAKCTFVQRSDWVAA